MKYLKYLLTLVFVYSYLLFSENDNQENPYIFASVNVITGEYTERHNDLILSGPQPLAINRFHIRDDRFRYGWQCNLPNLLNQPIAGDNGNFTDTHKISYEYDQQNRLKSLKVSDLVDEQICSWMTIQYSKDATQCFIQTHDDQQLTYHFLNNHLIGEVISSTQPTISYTYRAHPSGEGYVISQRNLPDGRGIEMEYYEKNHPHAGKVKLQKCRMGDSTSTLINHFIYHDSFTEVYDALNCKTIYRFSKGKITAIENYDRHGLICRAENLLWTETGPNKKLQIKTRYIADEKNNILKAHYYSYDSKGYLIKDTLYGNLSGLCLADIVIGEDGIPLRNGIESYSVYYEYVNGMLSCKTEDNGKKNIYFYESYDKPKAKLTCINEKVVLREFYIYNQSQQMICLICDDGCTEKENDLTGVTERHIKTISYKQNHPALGLPEVIEEKYLNLANDNEVLTKKTVNHYNHQAKIIQQDVYDSDNCYRYSLYASYDEGGRQNALSDANGKTILKAYDLNNNLIKTTSIDSSGNFQEITNFYDLANRLESSLTTDKDDNFQKVHYQYDVKGNKTTFIDECGNKTFYEYDDLGREIKVILPEVFNEELKRENPIKKKSYDALNRIISETDPKGLTSRTEYNAYGKPTAIYSPNQRIKKFVYNLDGSLKTSLNQPGVYTVFHRDSLGRISKEELFEICGKLIHAKNYFYNGLHLLEISLSEREKPLKVIRFEYDDAGRLISQDELFNEKIIKRKTYTYNSFGQQTTTREYFGENLQDFITSINEFDATGSALSTCVENLSKKLQKTTSFENSNTSLQPQEELVTNDLGQKVFQQTCHDSAGNVTITIFDALKRPSLIIKKDNAGNINYKQELLWDLNNHKVKEINFVAHDNSYTTIWKYDENDLLIEIIEGQGTECPKHTTFDYDEFGQLVTIQKADGVKIHYEYSSFGEISHLYSSDHTVDYILNYDNDQHITLIFDKVHQTTTSRTFSTDGCLLCEQQGNGFKTTRKYDALNRCIYLELADHSCIEYKYDGIYLKEILRTTPSGNTYKHLYEERDLKGNILLETLADNAAQTKYTYDTSQRITSIDTPYWAECIEYLDLTNTISKISIKNSFNKNESDFIYDSSCRLIHEKGGLTNNFTYNWQGSQTTKNHSPQQHQYDLNGNVKAKDNIAFNYDALNRLTAVHSDDGLTYRYQYDFYNRRLSKTCIDSTGNQLWIENYIYDGLNEIGSYDEKGAIKQLRVLGEGLGAEIGSAIALELNNKIYIPIHDHRGSICALIDAETHDVVEEMYYSAFGEEQHFFYHNLSPWRFSSKRLDPESKLIFFGKRYYDPSTSQWITLDPLRTIEGSSPYCYASNNPLSRIDPYGLFSLNFLWTKFYSKFSTIKQKLSQLLDPFSTFVNDNLSLEANFKNSIEQHALDFFGRNTLLLHGFYLDKEELGTFGQGEIHDKVRITLVNGILNARYDVLESAKMISECHGGNNIHYIFRPTEGWSFDFVKSMLVKYGWVSPQAKQLAARWRELISEMGGTQGGGKIIHYAHSIGAADTLLAKGLLSPEEMRMIQVYTFGSPSLLAPGGFYSVHNYVSKGDAVSYLDPFQYVRSVLNPSSHISFLPSSWPIPLIDHQLTFPSYSSILEVLGQQFLDNYRLAN